MGFPLRTPRSLHMPPGSSQAAATTHNFPTATTVAEEIDEHCRQLIQDHHRWCEKAVGIPRSAPCVFGDVVKVFGNDLSLPPLDQSQPQGSRFEAVVRAANHACLRVRHHCYTHNRKCALFGGQAQVADLDISGLPCPDMSRAGLQRFQDGNTSIVFAAHAKMHAQKRTKLLVIENVPDTLMQ